MKRGQRPEHSRIHFKVQDATGLNMVLNRDVLRRTYAAVKELCNRFYGTAVDQDGNETALSISFLESQSGDIVFIVDDLGETSSGTRRGLLGFHKESPSTDGIRLAAQAALRNTVFLAQAIIFVIEFGGVRLVPVTTGGLADLASEETSQRLRVPTEVAEALLDPGMQNTMRELLAAIGEEGAASIVIGLDPDTPERRLEFMIPAADDVIDFVDGAPLPIQGSA